ncbi:MAG: hypothetical protein AAGI30_05375 [Planctomycetota bacterium]
MEFLDYSQTAEQLGRGGLRLSEHGEDETSLLDIAVSHDELRTLVITASGGTPPSDLPCDASIEAGEDLGQAGEAVLALMHLAETLVFPTGRWRDVLDVAAFELASQDRWLDIDSEATLHQNRRDPLLIPPADKHILGVLMRACADLGEGPGSNLLVTSFDAPLVIQSHHEGYLLVQCVSDPVLDNLVGGFTG